MLNLPIELTANCTVTNQIYELDDCPQSKASNVPEDCKKINLQDSLAVYNNTVFPSIVSFMQEVNNDLPKGDFTKFNQFATVRSYLLGLKNAVINHKNWLDAQSEQGNRKKRCCQSQGSIDNAQAIDNQFWTKLNTDLQTFDTFVAGAETAESIYYEQGENSANYQQLLAQTNSIIAQANTAVAEAEGTVAGLEVQLFNKRLVQIGLVLVLIFFAYGYFKK